MSRLRSKLGPVLLALLLVTAGCTGNSGSTTDTATSPEPSEKLDVSDSYDIDANPTFTRVMQYLNGEDREPQPAMIPNVAVSSELIERSNRDPATRRFPAVLGLADESGQSSGQSFTIDGYTTGNGESVVLSPNLSEANAEAVLAHEFVHVAQSWSGWERVNDRRVRESSGYSEQGYDQYLASEMLSEGSAAYVEQWYAHEYAPNATRFDSIEQLVEVGEQRYRNVSGYFQYRGGPYYYGLQYFSEHVGETQALPDLGMDSGARERPGPNETWSVKDVYRFSGGTTERLLHPEADNESLRIPDLSVTGESESLTQHGTAGELFIRMALDQELSRDRAIAAAEGWGTDKVRSVSGTDGWLWVSRWDTDEDAAEFASAMSDFGDARPPLVTADIFYAAGGDIYENDEIPASVTVERPTDDTVVTYVGASTLPETLDVAVSNGGANVTVAAG